MGRQRRFTNDIQSLLVAAVLVCYAFLWLILKATGVLKTFAGIMGQILPAWFPLFNLIALPILVGVIFLRIVRPAWAILLVAFAGSFCYTLIGLSYHRYRVATIIVQLLVLAEMFWIIPRWRKARSKEKRVAQSLCL